MAANSDPTIAQHRQEAAVVIIRQLTVNSSSLDDLIRHGSYDGAEIHIRAIYNALWSLRSVVDNHLGQNINRWRGLPQADNHEGAGRWGAFVAGLVIGAIVVILYRVALMGSL